MSGVKYKYGYLSIPDVELTQALEGGIQPSRSGWKVLDLDIESVGDFIKDSTYTIPTIWCYPSLQTAGIYELLESQFLVRIGSPSTGIEQQVSFALAICEWNKYSDFMYRLEPIAPNLIVPLCSGIVRGDSDNNINLEKLMKCNDVALKVLSARGITPHEELY